MNVVWTEIPVIDMERAMRFYSNVFSCEMKIDFPGPPKMSFIPFNSEKEGSSATLIEMPEFYKPSNIAGPLVYFNCEDISAAEKRIVENGGLVLISKREISPEHGFMAVFLDTEGNRLALHTDVKK